MSDAVNTQADIVVRLREQADFWQRTAGDGNSPFRAAASLCLEAAENIEFLRKQSRGHFEALTVVLRDGIEAITPDPSELRPPGPKKAN